MAPSAVLIFDVATRQLRQPDCDSLPLGEASAAWVLVTFDGRPLGKLLVSPCPLQGEEIAELVQLNFPRDVAEQEAYLDQHGVTRSAAAQALSEESGEAITAVVCTTGNRQEHLQRCLMSLADQSYEELTILVVDNSMDGRARAIFDHFANDSRFSYTTERRPGLSCARNTSIDRVETALLAWIDDDEVADRDWIRELVAGFIEFPEAKVICGYMAPAELRTPAQIWFEQWGGHSKGRGFNQEVFRREGAQHPLYPLPSFGSGGNMAYRRSAIQAIGGFDEALGAGTASSGGEDTRAFSASIMSGGVMVFRPWALTFHYHRTDPKGLANQLKGYGTGITAFYTSVLMEDPFAIATLAKLAPTAIRDVRSSESVRNRSLSDDFPAHMMSSNLTAMLYGPWAYLQGRHRGRKSIF